MKRNIDFFKGCSELYAVIFGGRGYEHLVSRLGAANFISEAEKRGFCILPIFVGKNGSFYVYLGDVSDIDEVDKELDGDVLYETYPIKLSGKSGFFVGGEVLSVLAAVPILHGDYGEDGRVQGALDTAGIKFAGADTISGAVMRDKSYAKAVAASLFVPTLPWITAVRGDFGFDIEKIKSSVLSEVGYPAFVKPCRLGSSVGASCARTQGELEAALRIAFSVADRVIIERALLSKRELECAYFSVGKIHVISPPGEIAVRDGFYDYKRKYIDVSEVTLMPRAQISDLASEKIRSYTETLASALGARHIARFDYFLTDDGEVYFNEVNSFPGMTKTSLYSAMLAESGITFGSFIEMLLTET